jgi:hypothetical protein
MAIIIRNWGKEIKQLGDHEKQSLINGEDIYIYICIYVCIIFLSYILWAILVVINSLDIKF